MVLTNVRLTVGEHRAAKRRALELGLPLAELLRRGLLLVLEGGGQAAPEAREEAPAYVRRNSGAVVAVRDGDAGQTHADATARLEALKRTAGALRSRTHWLRDLEDMRARPFGSAEPTAGRTGAAGDTP